MKYKSLQKIAGKNIIQGMNNDKKNITEFYNSKIQKVLEVKEPKIQTKENFIFILAEEQKTYLDNSGNKIEDITNIKDSILPEKIREYTKKEISNDNIYYSKN